MVTRTHLVSERVLDKIPLLLNIGCLYLLRGMLKLAIQYARYPKEWISWADPYLEDERS
jgi:hypothetical protein